MKISNLKTATLLFSGLMLIQSCESASSKVKEEQMDLDVAKDNLEQAENDLKIDIEQYKDAQKLIILDNEYKISEYNNSLKSDNKNAKEIKLKINSLEKQNKDLEIKMEEYNGEGKENWENFKNEFNHDMEEFKKAVNNLTINDVK